MNKQAKLDQINEMIESKKRELNCDKLNREAIRAAIKRLDLVYMEIRKSTKTVFE